MLPETGKVGQTAGRRTGERYEDQIQLGQAAQDGCFQCSVFSYLARKPFERTRAILRRALRVSATQMARYPSNPWAG